MKTINVPLVVMKKKFVVPVRVQTIEDYAALMEDYPNTREKVTESVRRDNTVEAQRGPALVKLVATFLTTLTEAQNGLVAEKIASLYKWRGTLQDMKRKHPEVWDGESDKDVREVDQEIQWYETLQKLASMPFPRVEEPPPEPGPTG